MCANVQKAIEMFVLRVFANLPPVTYRLQPFFLLANHVYNIVFKESQMQMRR